MAWQARDTSMITDRRQAHDHQDPYPCRVTTHPAHPNCQALLVWLESAAGVGDATADPGRALC